MSSLPDLARHMSNIIARAEHEVFLATNMWQHSEPSRLITNGLRELSRRSVEKNQRAVVKILYDRATVKNAVKNHQSIPPKEYSDSNGPIRIPSPDELPNLDLEVINYHKPLLGTFHPKFMVVDRRIAIFQSDNIQDNDNLETMTHFEGPIVNSLYDIALISWHNAMNPPLPYLNASTVTEALPTYENESFKKLFDQHGNLIPIYEINASNPEEKLPEPLPEHTSESPNYDPDIASEIHRSASNLRERNSESYMEAICRHFNASAKQMVKPSYPSTTVPDINPFTPYFPHAKHDPFPCAVVCREPWGSPDTSCLRTPQNAAWTSALRHATTSVFIQTPDLNARDLLPEILSACRRGIKVSYIYCLGYNDPGELLPLQGGHNEAVAHGLYEKLGEQYHDNLDIYAYIAKDQVRPIHNKFKERSCHTKIMIADGHIGIQGSGNQDTQSWYHSQEVNVMIDSPQICKDWMTLIQNNQNSLQLGLTEKKGENSGCWLEKEGDRKGQIPIGSLGHTAGRFAWVKGVIGTVERVRGLSEY